MKKIKEYWFPWYPGRFKEDTMHLTTYQRGIYRELIDYYMETRKPIPNNDIALANIAKISVHDWIENSAPIRNLFKEIKTEKAQAALKLTRCDSIIADQAERREDYRERWKKGKTKKPKEINPVLASAQLQPITKDSRQYKKEDVVDSAGTKTDTTALSRTIGEITGWNNNPNWFGDYQRLGAWLASGWHPELDILPVIRRVMLKRNGEAPKGLKYFEQAIADFRAQRLQPTPKGNPNENAGRTGAKSHGKSERAKSAILEGLGLNAES